MTSAIHILNGTSLPDSRLELIAPTVTEAFRFEARIMPSRLDMARAYDNSRKQHSSGALLSQILSSPGRADEKCIAVVDADLYIPVLTFVFGEAQFGGTAAVVSTHRLDNQFYGLPPSDGLFMERLAKEIIHELGHTFGLYHCRQFDCVMHSSTYVEEIDLKNAMPCSACTSMLNQLHHRTTVQQPAQ